MKEQEIPKSKEDSSSDDDEVEFYLSLKVEVMTSFLSLFIQIPASYPQQPLSIQIEDSFNLKQKDVEKLRKNIAEFLQQEQSVYTS